MRPENPIRMCNPQAAPMDILKEKGVETMIHADTIRLLRESADVKIVVGGAVLTEDYAMRIGADFYARDAMATVRAAESVFGGD